MAIAEKEWIKKCNDSERAKCIAGELKVPLLIAQILVNRGITDYTECSQFLKPDMSNLHSPFLMKDMDKAVDRILVALNNNEHITIYGDYDVDGVTSSYIMDKFLGDELGANVDYYIPNRFDEGYGLNNEAIKTISETNTNLLITVDCGITSIKEVEYANSLGLDVIVTDHHQCGDIIPDALAVINPNREDCPYPFKVLCGAGIAFKLCTAVAEKLEGTEKTGVLNKAYELIEIAAIGTVADIVSLTGENRIIVKFGLERLRKTNNIGLKALMEVAGIEADTVNSYNIGFGIGPRINAGGRIESAKDGVELLKCRDMDEALELGKKLNDLNLERREIEVQIFEEAVKYIETSNYLDKYKVIVIAGENWHSGVIGIVASRLVEKYYRPVILLGIDGEIAKGSGRSIEGFNMFEMLESVNKQVKIEKFGGHYHAAGMTIRLENLDAFRDKLNELGEAVLTKEVLTPKVYIDYFVGGSEVNLDIVEDIKMLEPFGMGNEKPVLGFKDLMLYEVRVIGKNKDTIKIRAYKNNTIFDIIGFKMAYYAEELSKGQLVDIAFKLDKNEWNGNVNVQLILDNIKISESVKLKQEFYLSLADYISNVNFSSDEENNKILSNSSLNYDNLKFDINYIRRVYAFILQEQNRGNIFNIKSLIDKIYIMTNKMEEFFRVPLSVKILIEMELLECRDDNIYMVKCDIKKDLNNSYIYNNWEKVLSNL